MPDLDVLQQSLPKHWAKPYNLLTAGSPSHDVAWAVAKASSQSLANGGCPGLRQVADAAADLARTRDFRAWEKTASAVLDRSGHAFRSQIALEEALAWVEGDRSVVSTLDLSEVERLLAIRFIARFVRANLFSRVRSSLVGNRFADFASASEFEGEVLSSKPVVRVAELLAQDETGRRLSTFRRPRGSKQSTAALLASRVDE